MSESEHREANKRLLGAFVILVLLLVAFSFVVYLGYNEKPNEKFWDWLIALMATFISFPLGLVFGFFHLNRQNAATQRRRKEELRELLIVELQETRDLGACANRRPTKTTLTYIQPLILEEAVKSGLFGRELTKDMLKLAKTYHKYNDDVTIQRAAHEPKSIERTESLVEQTVRVLDKLNGNGNDSINSSA